MHLKPEQRYRLLEGLVQSLNDPKLDVRRISLKALHILTGQTRGFPPNGPIEKRLAAIADWEKWLEEYRNNL